MVQVNIDVLPWRTKLDVQLLIGMCPPLYLLGVFHFSLAGWNTTQFVALSINGTDSAAIQLHLLLRVALIASVAVAFIKMKSQSNNRPDVCVENHPRGNA